MRTPRVAGLVLALALCASAALASTTTPTSAPAPVTIRFTDDRGKLLTLPRSPQRIVSVLPALTETVCALGHCGRLVGVDRYSNHPASLARLPQVGGGLDPNLEAIVALRPDVVLSAKSTRGVERLESLGITVVALEPVRMADVRRVWQQLATVLQVDDEESRWQALEREVARAAQRVPPAARGQRVYFEASAGPYAAGAASFIGEMLERLGLRNVVPAELGAFPLVNPEFVVRAAPDWIFVGERTGPPVVQRPGWAALGAVQGGRVCQFTPQQGDILVRPGPRLAEAAHLIADCVQGRAGVQR
ncbi:MAG: hypothetical protein RL014_224 [Pseudomonadota bacterium]